MLYKSIIYFLLFLSLNASYAADSILVRPSIRYDKGFFHTIFFGKHYRTLWATPVKLEIFDVGKVAGGLTPVKIGGNNQTKSLRLVSQDGKEYVLRSIYKDPSRALVSTFFKKSLLAEMVIDQNSAENPYAALIVPYLAEAADVYYIRPKMVYIPYDERLGEYADDFANTIALFEARPGKGHLASEKLGEETFQIISTKKMLERVFEDPKNSVDEKMYARCRLLDMLISDWGRHEDQWRWAVLKDGERNIYRPIPRDRDHAFYKFDDGVLTWLTRKFLHPKLQTFDRSYDDVRGLNLSAEFLDKKFLNTLSEKDWLEIAESLRISMSDSIIENAVKKWPLEVYDKVGQKTIAVLKSRRNNLDKAAIRFYKILAESPELAGTDQAEYFLINRLDDYRTQLVIQKINQNGEIRDTLFQRIYNTSETKQLQLFGLDGADVFEIKGDRKKGVKLVIMGGRARDNYIISGATYKKLWIIDYREETELSEENLTHLILTDSSSDHYDRKGYKNERKKTEE